MCATVTERTGQFGIFKAGWERNNPTFVPMIIIAFFIFHWYFSLFFQTFFNHRYAAHKQFTMSRGWEKFFFIMNWVANGSSYLSPRAYGIMHRMHHAYADTEQDPHSPKFSKNLFSMMWETKKTYTDVYAGNIPLEERFTKGVPEWNALDKIAESWAARLLWGAAYTGIFALFATAWWQWILLPIVWVMGPFHGAVINWFAHKIGYRNFEVKDTSKNILPVDFLMLGEGYHNNHHKHASRPNFGHRWFELDPVYFAIRFFNFLGIIQLKGQQKKEVKPAFRFSGEEIKRIISEFKALKLDTSSLKKNPEGKLQEYLEAWEKFVEKDFKGDVQEYLNNIQVREKLQVFLDQANSNMKEKINSSVAKADQLFQEKMKPLDPHLKQKLQAFTNNVGHFWHTHGIVSA